MRRRIKTIDDKRTPWWLNRKTKRRLTIKFIVSFSIKKENIRLMARAVKRC